MDPIFVIVIVGILFALLMGGQASTPPPPTSFIFIPQPSASRSDFGCLPILVIGLIVLLLLTSAP